ncbi:MAG: cysteine hydrolase family protein [Salinivirgaceae bacterium]
MQTALILIDIQNDYFDGGKNPLFNSIEASRNAATLLSKFRKTDQFRVFIQHLSKDPNASFFVADSPGVEIHQSITPHANEIIIQKHFPNSFKETGLLEFLKKNNITKLVICGMMTHMCVDATVRAAKDFGFECSVIHNACATKDLEFDGSLVKAANVHHSFMAAFASYYSNVLSLEQFLNRNLNQ